MDGEEDIAVLGCTAVGVSGRRRLGARRWGFKLGLGLRPVPELELDEPKEECDGVGSPPSVRVGVWGATTNKVWDAGAVKGEWAGEGSGVGRMDL